MDRIEIDYKIDNLSEMTRLVQSPNLDISAGLTISIILGANVFSIENYNLSGNIILDRGAAAINGEWIEDGQLGYDLILYPISFYAGVVSAKLE